MIQVQKDFLTVACVRCGRPATVECKGNNKVLVGCGECFNKLDRVEDTLKGMADVVSLYTSGKGDPAAK